jgi:hypothetical protein
MRVPLLNLFITDELSTLFNSLDAYVQNRVSQKFFFENKLFLRKDERFQFGGKGTNNLLLKEEFYQKF